MQRENANTPAQMAKSTSNFYSASSRAAHMAITNSIQLEMQRNQLSSPSKNSRLAPGSNTVFKVVPKKDLNICSSAGPSNSSTTPSEPQQSKADSGEDKSLPQPTEDKKEDNSSDCILISSEEEEEESNGNGEKEKKCDTQLKKIFQKPFAQKNALVKSMMDELKLLDEESPACQQLKQSIIKLIEMPKTMRVSPHPGNLQIPLRGVRIGSMLVPSTTLAWATMNYVQLGFGHKQIKRCDLAWHMINHVTLTRKCPNATKRTRVNPRLHLHLTDDGANFVNAITMRDKIFPKKPIPPLVDDELVKQIILFIEEDWNMYNSTRIAVLKAFLDKVQLHNRKKSDFVQQVEESVSKDQLDRLREVLEEHELVVAHIADPSCPTLTELKYVSGSKSDEKQLMVPPKAPAGYKNYFEVKNFNSEGCIFSEVLTMRNSDGRPAGFLHDSYRYHNHNRRERSKQTSRSAAPASTSARRMTSLDFYYRSKSGEMRRLDTNNRPEGPSSPSKQQSAMDKAHLKVAWGIVERNGKEDEAVNSNNKRPGSPYPPEAYHHNNSGTFKKVKGYVEDEDELEDYEDLSSETEVMEYKKLAVFPPPPAKGGLTISNLDRSCLNRGEHLNDNIIEFYLKYMCLNMMNEERRLETHIFSCFFYQLLTQNASSFKKEEKENKIVNYAMEKRHSRVQTWTRTFDLFSKKFVFVPICERSHWFIVVICHPGLPHARIIDKQTNKATPARIEVDIELEDVTDCQEESDFDGEEVDDEEMDVDEYDGDGESESEETSISEARNNSLYNRKNLETSNNSVETDSEDDDGSTENKKSEVRAEAEDLPPPVIDLSEPELTPAPANEQCLREETEEQEEQPHSSTCQQQTLSPSPKSQPSSPPSSHEDYLSPSRIAAVHAQIRLGKKRKVLGEPYLVDPETGEKLDIVWDKDKYDYEEPCILVFDSLQGTDHTKHVNYLREYLSQEWRVRKEKSDGVRKFDKLRMSEPSVPQQDNYSDCGVYLLHYVETFPQNRMENYVLPLEQLQQKWFHGKEMARSKRSMIKKLIDQYAREQNLTQHSSS